PILIPKGGSTSSEKELEESKNSEESDLYGESEIYRSDKNTDDMNSSQYTYSSLAISEYENLRFRDIHYNDNSYENIFNNKDPKINVTYLYDVVEFMLIDDNQHKLPVIQVLWMELLVLNLNFYKCVRHIEEEFLVYRFEIYENTTVKVEKQSEEKFKMLLKLKDTNNNSITCCLVGINEKMQSICDNIIQRVLLLKYIKHLQTKNMGTIYNAAMFFLYDKKLLDLKNVKYDAEADSIILSYSENITDVHSINLSNRKMNILQLHEFLTNSNIKQCFTLNLTMNPLFLEETELSTIQNEINEIINVLKNINLNEIILDFINLSNTCGEYFISNLILNTDLLSLSLLKCNLNSSNITNITNTILDKSNPSMLYSITHLNVEFNELIYSDIKTLIKTIQKINKNFKKLYIYGNLIQTDIFEISYYFKQRKAIIETKKYYKHVLNIFHFNNIYKIKLHVSFSLRGIAEWIKSDNNEFLLFELYFIYLYTIIPEKKVYIIKDVSFAKKGELLILNVHALDDNKKVTLQLNLFKNTIMLQFLNIVKKGIFAENYYYEQTNNNKEINNNILTYFIGKNENDLNFYHYNVTSKEIHYILDFCKNNTVTNINMSCCYLKNEDILYFNQTKDYLYNIKVYKLSLNHNLINYMLDINEFIKFISNFKIYFKLDLSYLNIGLNPFVAKLFLYILNNNKCKILNFEYCNLTNFFLTSINENSEELKKNNYLMILSLQYNTFTDIVALLHFVNNIIFKCMRIRKIFISSNNLNQHDVDRILKNASKQNIVSFQQSYVTPACSHKIKKRILKLKKTDIYDNDDYKIEINQKEKQLIEKYVLNTKNKFDLVNKNK
ncbi:conserved protein, unknown function, partial [Hepatocystis sp. ex Piliocolobus tephrosceles]